MAGAGEASGQTRSARIHLFSSMHPDADFVSLRNCHRRVINFSGHPPATSGARFNLW